MGVLPTYLYKYRQITSKNDLSLCRNIQFLFQNYAMLNSRKQFEDPNDSRIEFIHPSKNALIQLRKEHLLYKTKIDELIETGKIQLLEKKFNDIIDQYGIYCFSSVATEYRMWGKYACEYHENHTVDEYTANHTGFCIEFIRKDFFPGKKVEYQEENATMNFLPFIKTYLGIPDNDNKLGKKVHKLLHIKLNKLNYENEYRFINTGYLPQGVLNEKKKYSESSVLSIIFGKDMETAHKEFIIKNIPFQVEFKKAVEIGYRKLKIENYV